MVSAAILHSFHCASGTITHAQPVLDKHCLVPMSNAASNKSLFTPGLAVGRMHISSPLARKGTFLPCIKALESTLVVASVDSSDINSQGPLEKKNLRRATFPNGFEELILEVCDETDVAELKVKVGNFEMNLRRSIGATKVETSMVSPSTLPPVPSKPTIESVSALPPKLPSKPSPGTTGPFENVNLAKSSRLVALEASGANGYVLVSSPRVGSFRRGRTVKGKRQPPICKEGDVIKEGQVIGYLDQFGSELPVKSDVTGEVLKLLYNDGEAVGYGDPLIAVLPSFHGIR